MENTLYKDLYNNSYTKIKMYDLALLPESDADEIMFDTIRPSIVKFRGCKQDLKDRDDVLMLFNFKMLDENFEILTNYMIIEYLTSNFILTQSALKAQMSNSDFHKYDNKDMLGKAIELRNILKKENDQLMIDYSFESSTLFTNPERLKGR